MSELLNMDMDVERIMCLKLLTIENGEKQYFFFFSTDIDCDKKLYTFY